MFLAIDVVDGGERAEDKIEVDDIFGFYFFPRTISGEILIAASEDTLVGSYPFRNLIRMGERFFPRTKEDRRTPQAADDRAGGIDTAKVFIAEERAGIFLCRRLKTDGRMLEIFAYIFVFNPPDADTTDTAFRAALCARKGTRIAPTHLCYMVINFVK